MKLFALFLLVILLLSLRPSARSRRSNPMWMLVGCLLVSFALISQRLN